MDLKIIYSRGGKNEFKETGIYPEYMTFFSEKYNGKWQCRYNSIPNNGSLYIENRIIYNYIYHGSYFEIQEVKEDGSLSDWAEIEISKAWCD